MVLNQQWVGAAVHGSTTGSTASLEELDRTFVLLCRFERWECPQVPAFAGFGIQFPGVQPILA